MGYGLGAVLVAVGLILALAVSDTISGIDLTAVGWIMALVGVVVLVLAAVTMNRTRGAHSTTTTTHTDGSQSVSERRTDI